MENLEGGNPVWFDHAFVYALDSNTIGISGENIKEWSEISCLKTEIPLKFEDKAVLFDLPENLRRFYQMDHKHHTVSISGNNILITISGDIVE